MNSNVSNIIYNKIFMYVRELSVSIRNINHRKILYLL